MNARHARFLLVMALLAGTPLAAQPALTGPEIFLGPANQMADLVASATATDASGRLMVVWVESLQGQGRLRGRVFDASGRPELPAFTLGTGDHPVVDATLAPGAPDGFLLAWQTSETIGQAERHRLLALRLSPSGQPRGNMIEIRSPLLAVRGFPTIGSMRTSSGPDGSFVAVWAETNRRTRRNDVFSRRFDAAGRPLAKAALLPNEGGNKERWPSALTVLDDGEIRIAWMSRAAEGETPALWVRRFDRHGIPLAAPVQLPPESSSISFGPDGGFLTAGMGWEDDFFVRLRAYAPDGTPLSEQSAAASLWGPQVTAERGGTFLVYGRDRSEPSICAVTGLQVEADGTQRGPAGCLTNPSVTGGTSGLSATGTANGGFALFWSESRRNGEQRWWRRLFGQFLATASPGTFQIERARSTIPESASEPLELRILRRDGVAGTVSVGYRLTGAGGDSGSGTVTFPDGDSTPRVISIPVSDDDVPGNDRIVHVALLRPTGGAVLGLPRRSAVEVRDDDEPSPLLARAEPLIEVAYGDGRDTELWAPDLAATPGGDFEVAWSYSFRHRYTDPIRYNYAVQGQRFDTAGQPTDLFDQYCSRPAERVRLAMHPEGDFMVFWQEISNTGTLTGHAQRFDALGAAAGPEVSLGYLPDSAAPLPRGRFLAVARGSDAAGQGLFAHFLSTTGIDRRSPVLVTRQALQPGSAAAVATDGIGRSVVVWAAAPTGDGPAGIFARRFNALGVPLGPVVRVSQGEGHDVAPGVATDVHGNFVVAWQRSWDGDGTGIYARVFNAAGQPLSAEIPVNSDTKGNQEAPSVALTGDGRFAVLWQSPTERDFDEYPTVVGQLFARDGTRLGREAEIEPAGSTPVVAWSDQGFFLAAYVWTEASIAARRLPL